VKTIAFVFVLAILAELALQGICLALKIPIPERRIEGPDPLVRADPELGWTFQNSRMQSRGFELKFNSMGLRSDTESHAPVELMFLGDSVTMGQQVPLGKTFVSLLQGLNAGADGYSTYQEYLWMKRDLWGLKPRKLGLIVSANDIISDEDSRREIRQTLEFNQSFKRFSLSEYEGLYRFYLWRKGALMSEQQDEEQMSRYYLKAVTDPPDETAWKDFTQNVMNIKQLVPDAQFFVVLSPPAVAVSSYRGSEHELWLNSHLKSFLAGQGIPFVDLLPELVASPEDPRSFFIDRRTHYSETGHQRVAQIIRRHLEMWGQQ
jgi:hypothetical protein